MEIFDLCGLIPRRKLLPGRCLVAELAPGSAGVPPAMRRWKRRDAATRLGVAYALRRQSRRKRAGRPRSQGGVLKGGAA